MTRRFECTDEKSNKSWEITVKGKTVTVQYGRVGTDGQTQVKNHATPTEAKAAAEKQIAEKVKKGYREVGGAAVEAAPKAKAKTAKKAVAKAASKAPAKKPRARKPPTPAGGVDAQQLAAIWTLLGQHNLVSQQQGIALLLALDDPAIWASLADGLSVDDDGHLVIPEGSEVRKRVSNWAWSRFGELVALCALKQQGRLAGLQRLKLRDCKELTDLTALDGLTALQLLHLWNCEKLTDLTGLAGLTGLRTLNLSGCDTLTDLTPLAGLTGLQELDLKGCKAVTNLTGLAGLTGLRTLNLSGCDTLTDLAPLAGLTGLQELDLEGCKALTDLTPLAGLTSCFPSASSQTGVRFQVTGYFRTSLWHDMKAGPWRVRIQGSETSDDPGQLTLPLIRPILDALSECRDAEEVREEGLLNLNVLLTSSKGYDWERLNSKYGETRWSLDKLELYFEEQKIRSWWNGTSTDSFTYAIDDPMPEGQFELSVSGAVAAVPPESLSVLAELIEEVRALRDADEDGDSLSEDDRDDGFDALSTNALIVEPSPWGMIITEDTSWGSIGRGDVALWEGPRRFDDPLEGIRVLQKHMGSAVPQVSDRNLLSSVVLSAYLGAKEDAKERKWTPAERKRRLQLARTVVEQFAAAASETLDAEAVYLFVGIHNGEPDAPDCLTFDPSKCRSGAGRWWKVEDALNTLLDASNKMCLDAIDERFLGEEDSVTIGIRTTLPFVATHRGCSLSEVLDEADLGRDFQFSYVNVLDGEFPLLRKQAYSQGELETDIFTAFQSPDGDRDLIQSMFLECNSSSPDRPYAFPQLLQLLTETATQPNA